MNDITMSGRFLLRIEPALHTALRRAADGAGLSLNEYCARKLASPSGSMADAGALAAVTRAASVAGEALAGVIGFGSWARAQMHADSDVDLLVVVDEGAQVTRELYRRWDAEPVSWDGRPVEPHFVSLPPADNVVAGIWAEAAIDGLVLFEREVAVSRRLARVRADIAAGRIIRRLIDGHPYWMEAA